MPDPSESAKSLPMQIQRPAPKPTSNRLFSERNARTRSTATCALSRSSFRPTKAGGGVPASGENGFKTTLIFEI
jgi:hypothetical protein